MLLDRKVMIAGSISNGDDLSPMLLDQLEQPVADAREGVIGELGPYYYTWQDKWPDWYELDPHDPPNPPLNTNFQLAIFWKNISQMSYVGHLDLVVTYPNGEQYNIEANENQDKLASPGEGWAVGFSFPLDHEGEYKVTVTLSELVGGAIAQAVFPCAFVGEKPSWGWAVGGGAFLATILTVGLVVSRSSGLPVP